ncbi:hypothetical protein IWX76_001767 [Pedobacter sp. CAN_A7]|uniref:hypothetical protein n=1 Tax=Pedobacter sp. CAN_A7 TaxID=2787722 RepID=UPI0018CBE81E
MLGKLLKSHQIIKWLVISAAGFLVVFGSVSLYMNIWVKPILAKQVKQLVASTTENLYHIEFSGITVNCLTGDASLSQVRFVPDTLVLKKLIAAQRAPNNIYHIELEKLSIRNVHPFRVYFKRRLTIDRIIINHPKITMVNKQYEYNENRPPRPLQSPFDFVSKYLKEVRVTSIDFNEVSFKYIDNNHEVPVIDSLQHLNVSLKDWLIDANSAQDTTRLYLLKDIRLQLSDYSFATADSMYHVKAHEINFSSATGNLKINNLALVPRYAEMAFSKVVGYSKDRFNIHLNDVELKGLDLPLFVKKQELLAREMNIRNGHVAVFNNNEIPGKDTIKTGQDPHQLLQKLPGKLTLRKVSLHNLDVSYAEYDRNSKQKGRISFEQTSGTITNITNVDKEKKKNQFMEIRLNTLLMGQGRMQTHFKFDLLAKDGAFSYSGRLNGLNGGVLNGVTKPLGMMHIKSGAVQELKFNIKANSSRAQGNMAFKYDDLAIAVLKREEGSGGFSRQGLLSLLANTVVINPANPNASGVFKPAKIDYERKPNRSFFNFIWKTLFQGIRHSVGVTPQKEAYIKAQLAKFEKMKADREKRKQAREKRKQNKRI